MNRHLRKATVVAAAITAGLLMTACQNDSATSGGSSSGKGTKDAAAAAVADSSAATKAPSGSKSSASKGVSGTFGNGTVTYLAPGKYIVSVPGKDDQQFFVAEDTEVYGVGTICGDAQSKVDAPCTLDELETATKKGAVNADVRMQDGVATLVSERRAAQSENGTGSDTDAGSGSRDTAVEGINKGKGVNGTWHGTVSYLAPGKYTVTEEHGVAQQFFVSEDTDIWGYGQVCGGPGVGEGQQGGTQCTEAELESAAKKGFPAEVKIANGTATTLNDTP
ncbi:MULTISPECIES: hypothetical protein [Streptomyces]|uniref:Lipoprotein n=1 Tax=Streptomyces plumbiresistens TaxID=511811 RepID=A0ABP7R1Z4_9ACTN|nr:hypothetical protein [Streptomyces sp. NBC_01373]MCX4701151.1 hypothetical protein [Streptomyces sp. NBC_01373]